MNEKIERAIESIEKENQRLVKMIYPYYAISSTILDQIILFTAPETGININGKGWPVGHSSDGWNENSFIPYYGTISIRNGRIVEFTESKHSAEMWKNIPAVPE